MNVEFLEIQGVLMLTHVHIMHFLCTALNGLVPGGPAAGLGFLHAVEPDVEVAGSESTDVEVVIVAVVLSEIMAVVTGCGGAVGFLGVALGNGVAAGAGNQRALAQALLLLDSCRQVEGVDTNGFTDIVKVLCVGLAVFQGDTSATV